MADLAPRLDLRQEIELRGRLAAEDEADPAPFLAWAEQPADASGAGWLRWYAWLGPIAVIALGLAQLAGVTAWPFWIVPLLLNLAIGGVAGRQAYGTIAAIAGSHRALTAYAAQLDLLAAADIH